MSIMLTDKQIQAIHHVLSNEEKLQTMHECAEALGLVYITEYCKIMCIAKRTYYDHVKQGKIKTFNKLPLINF